MTNHPRIAILRSCNKDFEQRIPIIPKHIPQLIKDLGEPIYIEPNYGQDFSYSDKQLSELGGTINRRENLMASADFSIILKPQASDLLALKPGSTVLGWMHCVQNTEMVSAAKKNKLTLFAMEDFLQSGEHSFKTNNIITGQQAIKHSLQVCPRSFKSDSRIVVIGYGLVAVSAINQLLDLGFTNITVCSRRDKKELELIPSINYQKIMRSNNSNKVTYGNDLPIIKLLKDVDIIVNAIGQDIYSPMIFLDNADLSAFKKTTLIVDISCDKNMGFEFSHITNFSAPITKLGNILYYAIDHIPTLIYKEVSFEISKKLVELLPIIIDAYKKNIYPKWLKNTIVIDQGKIMDSDIDYFQKNIV